MSALTDSDVMTFGQHKGEKLANVPARYLIWLYDEDKAPAALRAYIKANMDVLRVEAKREASMRPGNCRRVGM